MIVDAHCHVWPDHIAPKVLAARPVGMDARFDGTVGGLIATMDDAGIDMALALGIANQPQHVARTNEFIGSVDRSRLVPFGTVHPGLSDEENLRHLKDNGLAGVKLHPLFQDLTLGDPRVIALMTALAEAGVTVVTHVGAGGDDAANERGGPHQLRRLVDAVPELNVVAFHFGGYHLLDEAEKLVVGSDVWLETSWPPTLSDLDPSRVRALIERHGADRVVFGSDWPMTDPAAEIAAVRALGLSAEDEAAVLGDNLARLVGLVSA
jgi:predicted TIM-barrel fold metal-dependent hydrolase